MNVASHYGGHLGQPGGAVMFPGQPFMSGPVADMAVQYGHTLAGQGTEFVHKNVSSGTAFLFISTLEAASNMHNTKQ